MRIKTIMDENFQDYKKPSMLIATCYCDWKCCIEQGLDNFICQNSSLAQQDNIYIPNDLIIGRYLNNPITKAIIIGGLEPFLQSYNLLIFIDDFRKGSEDDIVIYTGYYPNELEKEIEALKVYKNIIIKFGRYKPNTESIFDETLGIFLASNNQFAIKIS